MNLNNEVLDIIEFKEEIATRLKLDFKKDIFDLQDEITNIIEEKRKILEFEPNKNIELNVLDTKDIEDIKSIKCYYISIRDKNDFEKNSYILFKDYEDAKKEYDDRIAVKTLNDWYNSSYSNFDDFFKSGDIVGKDVVDYFVNILPPIIDHYDLKQVGEPYDHRIDPRDNKWKPTYATFEKLNGKWFYKGNCFKGKNYDISQTNILDDLEKFKGYRILLQDSGKIVAFFRKDKWEINLEVNGDVLIEDKQGKKIALYDEELKKAIEDNTFAEKYNVVNNNWLELFLYKQNKDGVYEYYDSTYDSYSIEEIGDCEKDIQNFLEEILNSYIENEKLQKEEVEEI